MFVCLLLIGCVFDVCRFLIVCVCLCGCVFVGLRVCVFDCLLGCSLCAYV